MKFSEILKKIKKEEDDKIVLIKNGIFYIGIGKSAILLNSLFDLKLVCYKKEICKCGIPIKSLENYIDKLERTGYSYAVYDYELKEETILCKKIKEKEGRKVEIQMEHLNCERCWYKKNKIMKFLQENKNILENIVEEEK